MPVPLGDRLTAFVGEPLTLVLGTPLPNEGGVHMLPCWYEFRDDMFWVNAQYFPLIGPTLYVRDEHSGVRWVRIVANLIDVIDGPDDHMARLTQRYVGSPKPDSGIDPQTHRFDAISVAGGYDAEGYWVNS